jgi:hypothetical protein
MRRRITVEPAGAEMLSGMKAVREPVVRNSITVTVFSGSRAVQLAIATSRRRDTERSRPA